MKKSIKLHILTQYAEKNSGYILFDGLSEFDKKTNIVAVLTTKSSNDKTGNIYQITYFNNDNKSDKYPVCFDCPLLKKGCYVVPMGTASIFRAFNNGNYKPITLDQLPAIISGAIVRNGADGDPLSVPYNVVNAIHSAANVQLSYTHQWEKHPEQAGFHMASVETLEQAKQAQNEGWKTYRIIESEKSKLMKGEIICPNNFDKSIQCMDCQLCDGKKVNIAVIAHGGSKRKVINIISK